MALCYADLVEIYFCNVYDIIFIAEITYQQSRKLSK